MSLPCSPHGGVLSQSQIESPHHLLSLPRPDLISYPLPHSFCSSSTDLLAVPSTLPCLPVTSAWSTFPTCPHASLLPALPSQMPPSPCGPSRWPYLNVQYLYPPSLIALLGAPPEHSRHLTLVFYLFCFLYPLEQRLLSCWLMYPK